MIGGSQPPKKTFIHEPREGYIRLIQIRDYKSDEHLTFIPIDLAKRFCSSTDIMIGRYGPPIFQILRGLEGAYNVALMKAEPNIEILDQEFLYFYLQTPALFNYVAAGSLRTAGQDGVRKQHLNEYPVFLPLPEEQREIVNRIEAAFQRADTIEAEIDANLDNLNTLDQAILAKAFRGELVPQDPNDEPASELLKRIQAAKAAAPPKKKTKTRRTRKPQSQQLDLEL